MAACEAQSCAEETLLKKLKTSLKKLIFGVLNKEESDELHIVRRNKDLANGDFLIILPVHLDKLSDNTASELCRLQMCQLQHCGVIGTILVTHCSLLPNHRLHLSISRPPLIQHIMKDIHNCGPQYGCVPSSDKSAVVHCAFTSDTEPLTLDRIRELIVADHTGQLLTANGYQVEFLVHDLLSDTLEMCSKLGVKLTTKLDRTELHNSSNDQSTCDLLRDNSAKCGCLIEPTKIKPDSGENATDFEINLRHYIAQSNLPLGGEGYDRNIHKYRISTKNEVLQQTSKLYTACCRKASHPMNNRPVCVHVTGYRHELSLQQTDLCLRIATHDTTTPAQCHVVCGPVKTPSAISPHDYYQLRLDQMKQASVMKYGDMVQGEGWDVTIETLTRAAVKFEMLSTVCRQQKSIDPEKDKLCSDFRGGGVFVMYNCARLATLLANYEEAVKQGVYPSLPEISEIDFSLLKDEDEWLLIFSFLLPYPDLVRETVTASITSSNPRTPLLTHKVCQFLLDLSRAFSSYYSRTHILGESRDHLYPEMFARIYLLQCIQQVMHNALSLLNIQPVNQL